LWHACLPGSTCGKLVAPCSSGRCLTVACSHISAAAAAAVLQMDDITVLVSYVTLPAAKL
jgi:hypothetical protein